jgi:curved DNA-binding protein CbpA
MVSRRPFSSSEKFSQEYVKIKLQEYIYEFNINLYTLLKVPREATPEEIEKAYKS